MACLRRSGRPSGRPALFISRAALLVKVTARISEGLARPRLRICAIRVVSTRVLPVPAPASTSTGPSERFDRFALLGVEAREIRRAAGRTRTSRDPAGGGGMCGRSGTLVRIVQRRNSLILSGCKMALAPSICEGRGHTQKVPPRQPFFIPTLRPAASGRGSFACDAAIFSSRSSTLWGSSALFLLSMST